jgi:hypothetical protein
MVNTHVLSKGGRRVRAPSMSCESSYAVCISRRLSRQRQGRFNDILISSACEP